VNTACYVQNRVLVNKSHNKTPYELFNGRSHAIGFLKPFGYHVMVLTTLDNLGKFKAKKDEGYFLGVLVNKSQNKTPYELFNGRTPAIGFLKPFGYYVMILNTLDNQGKFEAKGDEEFLENKAIEKGASLNWLFDIDSLTKSMNYVPVDAGTNSTNFLGTKDAANQEAKKYVSSLRYIALPNWVHDALLESSSTDQMETLTMESPSPTDSSPVPTACLNDSPEPSNEAIGVKADVSNIETSITASPTSTLRIHKDHPKSQIIGPVDTLIQTRYKSKVVEEQSFIATIHQKTNPALL
nr:hypothetical protein [Tanacetum cinerariifolium]